MPNDLKEKMAHSPVASVIMAVRDGQQWLSAAIDSILTQTFSDLELLIIDDGSTDETPNILADYRARDRRVLTFQQAREGLVCALNRGLAHARGPLIARLDADDVALPQRLQRQIRYLDEHPEIALLGAWAQVIDELGRPKRRRLQPPADPKSLARTLATTNPFIHSSVMFRAAVARDLGGYRSVFEAAEDYDLWLRLAEVGGIAILPEVLIQYRQHGSNVTKANAVRQVFSVRLAKLSREARRQNGYDPLLTLSAPPDWHVVPEDAFYADIAGLCRVLELADPAIAGDVAVSSIDLDVVFRRISDLTSAERKLAQLALINLIRRHGRLPRYTTHALLTLLFRLHPTRALGLFFWQARLQMLGSTCHGPRQYILL